MAKKRLDVYLTEKFKEESRQLSQNHIIQGLVTVNGQTQRKPGYIVKEGDSVEFTPPAKLFASRGGIKLAHALDIFGINPAGCICIDIGASTGGFTDCLLKKNAAFVYAVDVGKGQLDYSLRINPAVKVLEETNARYLNSETIPQKAGIITIDVSFISLDKILPAASTLLTENGVVSALVKPQFEAGKGKTDKGVVRDRATHVSVLENAVIYGQNAGLYPVKCTYSPIKGPSGNIEFLMMYSKAEKENECRPSETVANAWNFFEKGK